MVTVRCEAGEEPLGNRCRNEAVIRRYIGAYYSLCDGHRLLPNSQLFLYVEDPVRLYHRIWKNNE